jgi:hypothetical protein
MHTNRFRIPAARRALGAAIAGALAAGALAGPAMAATDDGGADPQCRKAGEKPLEYLVVGKAGDKGDTFFARTPGGDKTDVFHAHKADGEPQSSIIAI